MPSGLKRFHHTGQSHFVTFTCYHRLPHLVDEMTSQAFVVALERARKLYQFRVYGFVAMPEHAHLLISEPESGTIATAVQALKISSSLRTARARDAQNVGLRYGRSATLIATFATMQSSSKNCNTSIAIPLNADWWSVPRIGSGAVSVITHCMRNAA